MPFYDTVAQTFNREYHAGLTSWRFFVAFTRLWLKDRGWRSHSPIVQLPGVILVMGAFWFLIYKFVGSFGLVAILPKAAQAKLRRKAAADPTLKNILEINGTAFINAISVTPISLITVFRLWNDPYYGTSRLFDLSSMFATGYFFWDVLICYRYRRQLGSSILLHAIMSLIACSLQLSGGDLRISWIAASMLTTEISTPFLYVRWALLEAEQTATLPFRICNIAFIVLYSVYRLVAVELMCLIPFTRDMYLRPELRTVSLALQLSLGWVWIVLNYFWGFRLVSKQFKRSKRTRSARENRDEAGATGVAVSSRKIEDLVAGKRENEREDQEENGDATAREGSISAGRGRGEWKGERRELAADGDIVMLPAQMTTGSYGDDDGEDAEAKPSGIEPSWREQNEAVEPASQKRRQGSEAIETRRGQGPIDRKANETIRMAGLSRKEREPPIASRKVSVA